ncbi:unnamed protein product [Caenorhabditis sp. 36 PRJEB53466]|nr:unnamed protein product [Caenorhabditis sp. 36 PRJEB53466]
MTPLHADDCAKRKKKNVCSTSNWCRTTWIVAGGAIKDQGCVTTRSDLSDQKCRTNRKGLVSCLCDSEKCNDASFSIASDVTLVIPPVIKCHSGDVISDDNFCFGHACTYKRSLILNDFGDILPSKYAPDRGCDSSEYNHDFNSMNTCIQTDDQILCYCNTEYCNLEQPYPVPVGPLLCYLSDDSRDDEWPYSLKFCYGHVCYIPKDNYRNKRGCMSVSDGAPEELKRGGENEVYRMCVEDLCNGEYNDS